MGNCITKGKRCIKTIKIQHKNCRKISDFIDEDEKQAILTKIYIQKIKSAPLLDLTSNGLYERRKK